MKTYWLLTRMMLKNTLSGMNPFTQNNSRKKGAAAGKGIFIGLMLISLMIPLIGIMNSIG